MNDKISCVEFGKQLLKTNDLDPVYVLLHHSDLSLSEMKQWLIAYWCFYHMGTASWIMDDPRKFWSRFEKAAGSKEYPRSSERRHFRGENARKSYEYLRQRTVDGLWEDLRGKETCDEVMRAVQLWVGFGPWISFKVADMLERVCGLPIAFGVGDVYLFDSPREGAERLRESVGKPVPDESLNTWAVGYLLKKLRGYVQAPPARDRELGPQEVETVLCKWKSYLNGHYEVGEDIRHCREGLERFSNVTTCQRLLRAGKLGRLW